MAYLGFARLRSTLTKKPGVKDPSALAAAIGRLKYGAKRFQKAAVQGEKLKGAG